MPGKFINMEKTETLTALVEGFKERLKNPYYLHSEKKATIVEYFRQNIEASTLDEALKIVQQQIGPNSPIRYNKISNFYIYGIEQIQVQLENEDFGVETATIEGEGIILPNSIIPIPGDYFRIYYLENPYIFKVLDVTSDTLENGANLFKIQYKFDKDSDDDINKQVVGNYDMLVNNVGTDYKVVIESSEKDYILRLEEVTNHLKKYYKNLFYQDRVETFIFNYNTMRIYDPYLIEFIIRNRLMEGDSEYISICQQLTLPATFPLDYDKSMFRSIELRDIKRLNKALHASIQPVNQPLSSLYMRQEDYYYLRHLPGTSGVPDPTDLSILELFTMEFFDSIKYMYKTSSPSVQNIIIKYFSREVFNGKDMDVLDKMDYQSNIYLFYHIPILIYVIEKVIIDILKGVMKIPRVDIGIEPTIVTYHTGVVKSFSDSIYAYFTGSIQGGVWIVNRYNKDNDMKVAVTQTEPLQLSDCQNLVYV